MPWLLQESWVIGPLAVLTELTDLILAGNRIDDVTPLAGLNRVVVLDLTSNQISDVDDLGVMEGLRYLKLDDNEINDVSSLGHLTSLKFLHLSSNIVTLGVRNLDALTEASSIVMLGNDKRRAFSIAGPPDASGFLELHVRYLGAGKLDAGHSGREHPGEDILQRRRWRSRRTRSTGPSTPASPVSASRRRTTGSASTSRPGC